MGRETLDAVVAAVRAAGEGLSAAETAELIGASRITARRYLEYLADTGLSTGRRATAAPAARTGVPVAVRDGRLRGNAGGPHPPVRDQDSSRTSPPRHAARPGPATSSALDDLVVEAAGATTAAAGRDPARTATGRVLAARPTCEATAAAYLRCYATLC
jgi:hypothetical protein